MLASLEMQLAQMTSEAQAINSTPAGDSEAAKNVRQLENRLDKAVIKCNEAKHIRKTYETILQKLQEVRLRCARVCVCVHVSVCAFCIAVCEYRYVLSTFALSTFTFRKGWSLITR